MISKPLGTRIGGLVSALLATVLLTGCFEGPEVSFFGGGQEVFPGETISLAIVPEEPARGDVSIELFALSFPAGAFLVPESVTLLGGESGTVFNVTALDSAREGDNVEIRIVSPNGGLGGNYTVGSSSSVVIRVAAKPMPALSLVGPDLDVVPGEGFTYVVQRTECLDGVTVPVFASGNAACFALPASVSLPANSCSVAFSASAASAGTCIGGFIDISLVAPPGYVLGADSTARVTLQVEEVEVAVARLQGLGTLLSPGDAVTLAVALDRTTEAEISVNILAIGSPDEFTVPTSVVIPAEANFATFEIVASDTASPGAAIEVSLRGGPGYAVDTGSVTFTVEP